VLGAAQLALAHRGARLPRVPLRKGVKWRVGDMGVRIELRLLAKVSWVRVVPRQISMLREGERKRGRERETH
jgi:hypothetical protein